MFVIGGANPLAEAIVVDPFQGARAKARIDEAHLHALDGHGHTRRLAARIFRKASADADILVQ